MRSKRDGVQPSSDPQIEAEFNFGYLYRTLENHVDTFAATAGNPFALDDIADRVGQLFRLKAQKIRAQLGAAELLLEMRQNGASAGGRAGDYRGPASRPALSGGAFDDRPLKPKRILSAKALRAISKAQKLRWKKHFAAQAEGEGKPGKRKPGQYAFASRSKIQKTFWGRMTKAERSAEMFRRKQVASGKAAPQGRKAQARREKTDRSGKVLGKGVWLREMAKLLAAGPRPRAEIRGMLLKRFPGKDNALTVAFAALKRQKYVSEADGVFTLNPKAVEASA